MNVSGAAQLLCLLSAIANVAVDFLSMSSFPFFS